MLQTPTQAETELYPLFATSLRAAFGEQLAVAACISTPYMLNTRNDEKNTVFCSFFSLFCEYIRLEYERIHVTYRGNQAEYRNSYSCGCATGIREYLFNT